MDKTRVGAEALESNVQLKGVGKLHIIFSNHWIV